MQTAEIISTNTNLQESGAAIFSVFAPGNNRLCLKTRLHWFSAEPSSKIVRNFESYIGLELSLVPEVEKVFVRCDDDTGKSYTVVTVVNERNREVRARVYQREQALMDAARGIAFSFRVISRAGRDLRDAVENVGIGKVAFER